MSDIVTCIESLSKIHRTGARQSGVFGEIEIRRNVPSSWAQALGEETSMRSEEVAA